MSYSERLMKAREQIEPNAPGMDQEGCLLSLAISAKRIADLLETLVKRLDDEVR